MLNGAQVIVDYLIQEKVPQVFGLCGHGNIQFIDALYERSADIKTISVHHESVAGFMADVYYRVSGKATATFTSCGPGSAQLPISLATAYLDSVPFLAVTGNVPTSQFNRGAFQEMYRQNQADFPSTVRSLCKRVFQPTRGEMVPLAVRQAWKTMMTGRPGPVVLDVPYDVFMESAAEEAPNAKEWNGNISSRCGANPEGVVKAVDMLLGADRRAAAEFSFWLAMPTMAGAFAYDLYKSHGQMSQANMILVAVGFAVSFVCAWIVVKTFLGYVQRNGFALFAWWRVIVGSLGLIALALGK